jgi:hypothetical protein
MGAQAARPSNASIQTIPLLPIAGEVLAKKIVRIRFVFMCFFFGLLFVSEGYFNIVHPTITNPGCLKAMSQISAVSA